MGLQQHATFQVAVKALVWDGTKILTLDSVGGHIDFPGGRVDESELTLPWQESLRREIIEELGSEVSYTVGDVAFVSKRTYMADNERKYIAAIYFNVTYDGGEPVLSEEHSKFKWRHPVELLKESDRFLTQDEFEQYKDYILKHPISFQTNSIS